MAIEIVRHFTALALKKRTTFLLAPKVMPLFYTTDLLLEVASTEFEYLQPVLNSRP
jgi:hypothetical protein